MSNFQEKFISVKKYVDRKSFEESEIIGTNEEFLEVENFNDEDIRVLSKKGFFHMPNYITYLRETALVDEVLESLQKNRRKKARKGLKALEELEVVKESPVMNENYISWRKVYEENITGKDLGIVNAPVDWVEKAAAKGSFTAGVFAKKKGVVIAGIIARSYESKDGLPRRFSISFSAVKDSYKDMCINEALNVMIISYAKELGFTHISRGKDVNIYGKHLSTGIPVFKLSLGYEIIPVSSKPDILMKPNNLDEFNENIFFASYEKLGSKRLTGNFVFKGKGSMKKADSLNKPFFSTFNTYSWNGKSLELQDNQKQPL